jgi:hypothetical protein
MAISNFPAFAILGCSDFTLFVMVDYIISQQIYYNTTTEFKLLKSKLLCVKRLYSLLLSPFYGQRYIFYFEKTSFEPTILQKSYNQLISIDNVHTHACGALLWFGLIVAYLGGLEATASLKRLM